MVRKRLTNGRELPDSPIDVQNASTIISGLLDSVEAKDLGSSQDQLS
jgi:hypothetical protein